MIGKMLSLSAFLGFAIAALPAAAQITNPPSAPPPSGASQPPAGVTCPPTTHWEPAGYVGHGKYRPARCARDDGRE